MTAAEGGTRVLRISPANHEWVYRELRDATEGLSGQQGATALRHTLNELEQEIKKNPSVLKWLSSFWIN